MMVAYDRISRSESNQNLFAISYGILYMNLGPHFVDYIFEGMHATKHVL